MLPTLTMWRPAPRFTGDGYVINGSKAVVLNGPEADLFLVSARVGDNAIQSKDGISLFDGGQKYLGLTVQ